MITVTQANETIQKKIDAIEEEIDKKIQQMIVHSMDRSVKVYVEETFIPEKIRDAIMNKYAAGGWLVNYIPGECSQLRDAWACFVISFPE